jgi:hypothetical protein
MTRPARKWIGVDTQTRKALTHVTQTASLAAINDPDAKRRLLYMLDMQQRREEIALSYADLPASAKSNLLFVIRAFHHELRKGFCQGAKL